MSVNDDKTVDKKHIKHMHNRWKWKKLKSKRQHEKGTKKWVIKREVKFGDYKNCLEANWLENEIKKNKSKINKRETSCIYQRS